jgi:hypothetical protein
MASAAANYRALARRVATLPERVVRAGAEAMNREIIAELKADTGGDQALSGFGRSRRGRKTKLATTTTISGGRALASAVIKASPKRARGMWTIIEEGTGERISGRKRGGGGLHMEIPGEGWRTGPWSAGRSPAKHTFTDGVRRGTRPAEQAMAEVFDRETR